MTEATIPGTVRQSFFFGFLRALCPLLLLGLALGLGAGIDASYAATKKPAKKTSARNTTAKKATTKRAPAKRASTAKRKKATAKKSTTARRARTVRRRAPTRSARFRGQKSPTTDRYREIQQALQSNGFLDAEPNGKWDETSASAMKRFQQQHDISPTGKINALSLIALGLGPKRGPAPGSTSVLEPAQPAVDAESNERE
ncbi:MAG: peptidoglycan-binding protein [Bryobacterales bacterium]|nr:peptidoglycan-binding protein [Bryobacterales bacterium]